MAGRSRRSLSLAPPATLGKAKDRHRNPFYIKNIHVHHVVGAEVVRLSLPEQPRELAQRVRTGE